MPLTDNSILEMMPDPSGGLLWAATDPAWGNIDAELASQQWGAPPTADFGNQEGFLATDDSGERVRFGFGARGTSPAWFDVGAARLQVGDAPGAIHTADGTSAGVDSWHRSFAPSIAGRALPLKRHEYSLVLAAASPDGFFLGTIWSIYSFSPDGTRRWRIEPPGVTSAVVPSGSGEVLVAAHGDGTIRWYRATDGGELLALFPHADQRRWVAWTPSGYYAASPGGEDLIGWQVDHGPDATPDFYPASKFRDRYYRPDVVAAILDTLDEKQAVAAADAARATLTGQTAAPSVVAPPAPPAIPVVTIRSPGDLDRVQTTEVVVQVSVRSPDGRPVREVYALVDGRAAGAHVTAPGSDGTWILRVPMPPKDATIAVLAKTDVATSDYSTVHLSWAGAVPSQARQLPPGYTHTPKLYVLAVGSGLYTDKAFEKLAWPATDATKFSGFWSAQEGKPWADVAVRTLPDGQATREAVLDGLEWIRRSVTRDDVGVILLDGHGTIDPSTSVYSFAPVDARKDKRVTDWIPQSQIIDTLRGTPGKLVLFVDTCHSGGLTGAVASAYRGDLVPFLQALTDAGSGIVECHAATRFGAAAEGPAWKGGAFTTALLEGLAGKAARDDGFVWIDSLDRYVADRVRVLTDGEQDAGCTRPGTVDDFPIAVAPR